MILLMIFITLVLFQSVRRARDNARLCEFRHGFFALRDRLRRIAIDDPTLGRNWLFPYLDSTLSKAIDLLPHMSAWQVLALAPVADQKREQFLITHKHLMRELAKPRSAALSGLYNEMWQQVAQQIMARHFVMKAGVVLLARTFQGLRKAQIAIRRRERRSLELVLLDEAA
jgi:hypothetical protein